MKVLRTLEKLNLVKVLTLILEIAVVLAMIMVCMTVYVQQVKAAGPEGVSQFQEMIGRTAQEGNLITAFVIATIGIVAIPFGYFVLWLHRLDKYMSIRRIRRKLDQRKILQVEEKFNHRVLDEG